MKLDFFVARTDKMVDYMGSGGVSAATAEPFVASKALYDAGRIMDTAIAIE
jgi:hypothetical protein